MRTLFPVKNCIDMFINVSNGNFMDIITLVNEMCSSHELLCSVRISIQTDKHALCKSRLRLFLFKMTCMAGWV